MLACHELTSQRMGYTNLCWFYLDQLGQGSINVENVFCTLIQILTMTCLGKDWYLKKQLRPMNYRCVITAFLLWTSTPNILWLRNAYQKLRESDWVHLDAKASWTQSISYILSRVLFVLWCSLTQVSSHHCLLRLVNYYQLHSLAYSHSLSDWYSLHLSSRAFQS
jgi:hypothetical protein